MTSTPADATTPSSTGQSNYGSAAALPSPGGLDRGRVFTDLACAIADGARVISDFRVMGDQGEVFGPVAPVPTAWRTLKESAARPAFMDWTGKAKKVVTLHSGTTVQGLW